MKNIYQLLLCVILLFAAERLFAQTGYIVSGTVTNEKGEPLKSATVFITGSERVTPTDENGKFRFAGIPPGNFQLSVQMIGFAPFTQNFVVKDAPVEINPQLKTKAVNLQQVVIGNKKALSKNLKLFTETFLGESANARQCVIVNPEIIYFSTKKGHLLADADDFLIIENKRLGYRLHYLLKSFDYDFGVGVVLYHGDCSFEELEGTDGQEKQWTKNRYETYKNSFMHFLRSVHNNKTIENGFITRPLLGYATYKFDNKTTLLRDRIITKDRQVMFDSLINVIDTNFTSFKFNQPLYITYEPKASTSFTTHQSEEKRGTSVGSNGSVLKLVAPLAMIDKKGSYTDYRDFLIEGHWATNRVGDQLPIDYQPPVGEIDSQDIQLDPLLTSLQKWKDSLPQEKAYLHLDKPYYATGDTIWFKGYLTTGSRHQLSPLSGAVYVDLINDQNKPVKTLKLPVDSGTVAGDLILNEDVKTGSYRIRAYTQWMRNAGEDYFFDRAFTVGNPIIGQNKEQPNPDLQQTDVQFFPESGKLINGVTSRVGFKATGTDGLGVAISGTITDNEHNQVSQFSTLHAGMGSFLLKPLPGKAYTANIKFADGSNKNLTLPGALNEGYVLSVYQPTKDSLLVRILASASLEHSAVKLIAQSSGEVLYTAPVVINGPINSIWLDKSTFPSGIVQFTIFDTSNQPLNERIAFIKNNDRMQLAVKTDKAAYKSKEHVQLELNAKDNAGNPLAANFSVAVTDENQVPVDESAESTIFSNILLKSDIKGYVEKPNYYFMADTGETEKALDNLMLTQGYRRFEWQRLDSMVNAGPAFKAESLRTTISGRVTNLQYKALPNAIILLVSPRAHITRTTTTDSIGRFTIDSLLFTDSTKFAIQARTKENSSNAIITLDSIPKTVAMITTKQSFADIAIIKTNLQKAEQAGTPAKFTGLHMLKQVDIKAKKTIPVSSYNDVAPQGMFALPDEQSADHIYTMTNPENYIDLKTYIEATISGVRIKMDARGDLSLVDLRPGMVSLTGGQTEASLGLTVNGRPIVNKTEITNILTGSISPEEVARIDVVRTNLAIASAFGNGLFILTKKNATRRHYDPNVVNIALKGFNQVRQFYSPRYDRPDIADNKPDPRTTIYWSPYVNTDATGKATLDFYNADGPGTYRVVVEGINAAGELGRTVYTYKVD